MTRKTIYGANTGGGGGRGIEQGFKIIRSALKSLIMNIIWLHNKRYTHSNMCLTYI